MPEKMRFMRAWLSPRRGAGQAGCRRSLPSRSRQSATPEHQRQRGESGEPGADEPGERREPQQRRPGKGRGAARAAAAAAPRPCRAPPARRAADCARARRRAGNARAAPAAASRVSALSQPAQVVARAIPTWARNCIRTRVSGEIDRHRRDRDLDRRLGVVAGEKRRRQHLDQDKGRQPGGIGGERRRGRRGVGRR